MGDETPLTIGQRAVDQGWLLEAVGEIEVSTSPRLQLVLLGAIDEHPVARIIVDMRQVEYLDSAGLGLLMEAARRLRQHGRRLCVLVAMHSQPARVIELAAFSKVMEVASTLDQLP